MSKRCLDSKIISSDKFTQLDMSAKLLYIYLIFEADNYGFLASAYGTVQRIGTTTQDLKQLIDCGFLLKLPNDVYCIVHWFIHNKEDKRLTPDFQEIEYVELRNKQWCLRDDIDLPDGYKYLPSDTL